MLEGILVDLVPYGEAFLKREHHWQNSEAWFWASAGDRTIASRAEVERQQAGRTSSNRHHPGSLWFGIQTKDGTPLGDIVLNWIEYHHRQAMIGMGIGESDTWGRGYGTDALLLIVEYAFDWMDLRRVWLSTLDTNIRMQRLAEKLGFVLEARRRGFWFADGEQRDDIMYGLLRDEWPGRAALLNRFGLTGPKS